MEGPQATRGDQGLPPPTRTYRTPTGLGVEMETWIRFVAGTVFDRQASHSLSLYFRRSAAAHSRSSRACAAMDVAVGMGGSAGGTAGPVRPESEGGLLKNRSF